MTTKRLDNLLLNLAKAVEQIFDESQALRNVWYWEYYHAQKRILKNKQEQKKIYNQIYHLEKFGYINKKGFTKKGILRLLKAKTKQEAKTKKKWDGRWCLVIFDIPEKQRLARGNLRTILRELGFLKLQNSVWVSPDDYFNLLQNIVREYRIAPFVVLMEVKRISNDLLLKPCDYLIVKKLPDWEEYKKVTVKGEVRFPGEYIIKKGEKLSSVLERVGGFTENAFLKGIIFTREEIKKKQMANLERFKKMQYDLLMKIAISSDKPESIEQLMKQQETINQLISLFPLGRISLKITEPEKLKDSPYDIYLEDGDTVYVPKKPGTVMVMGAVNSPGTIIYTHGKDLEWYIEKRGGYNNYSDKKNIIVIHADGSCQKKFVRIKEIEEGDIIIVPERAVYSKWGLTKDIIDMFYKIALPIAIYAE